jgi:hypothetical protein
MLDRRLAPDDLAHAPARLLHQLTLELGVRAGKVDVLEDAEGAALALDDDLGLDALLGQRDQLAGLDLAQELSADDVEGAAL